MAQGPTGVFLDPTDELRAIEPGFSRGVYWPVSGARYVALAVRLVVDTGANRRRILRLPVATAAVVCLCTKPKSLVAMQATEMVLDVVIPCCAF
jgi:hypothetical protein